MEADLCQPGLNILIEMMAKVLFFVNRLFRLEVVFLETPWEKEKVHENGQLVMLVA